MRHTYLLTSLLLGACASSAAPMAGDRTPVEEPPAPAAPTVRPRDAAATAASVAPDAKPGIDPPDAADSPDRAAVDTSSRPAPDAVVAEAAARRDGGGERGDPLAGMGAVTKVGGAAQPAMGSLEGPFWRADTGELLFCAGKGVRRLVPPARFDVFKTLPAATSGITQDAEGRLIIVEWEGRRVLRLDGDQVQVIADRFDGKPLNTPNDVTIRKDGAVYFTDISLPGVFRLSPQGKLESIVDLRGQSNPRPNGIALSPDEQTLYVGFTGLGLVRRYPLGADGSLGAPRDFARRSVPDGIAVDDDGNVYIAGSGGVQVHRPDGAQIGMIAVPSFSTNVSFGDRDRRTLYVTTDSGGLFSVRLAVPGLP